MQHSVRLLILLGAVLAGAAEQPQDLVQKQWVYGALKDSATHTSWPVAYYVNDFSNNRYQGLLLRCSAPGSVIISFAFGQIMDTDRQANIEIFYGFDDGGNRKKILETKNHTNAILEGEGTAEFLLQLRRHQSLKVRSRSWPHGWVSFRIPLAVGQSQIGKLLRACQLDDNQLARLAPATQAHAKTVRSRLHRLLLRYWQAGSDASARARLARRIEALQPNFGHLVREIRGGSEKTNPESYDHLASYQDFSGQRRSYYLHVPTTYAADKATGVFLFLHGGTRRPAWKKRQRWWPQHPALAPPGFISVYPNAWKKSYWWQPDQVENIRQILIRLRRDYNIDDNRIFLSGASDGGTGTYYFAFRHPTPFAGFLIFLSLPDVLRSPQLHVPGRLFLPNLENKPLLLINGANDRKFPATRLRQYLMEYRQNGIDVTSFIVPEGAHDMKWLTQYREPIERFLRDHIRDPYPDHLIWQAQGSAPGHRIHWLIIEKTRPTRRSPGHNFYGTSPWIETETVNNLIRLKSNGVSQVRLLISTDVFDFSKPLTVEANGTKSVYPAAPPSAATLLKWYQQDDDRSMLFGRELLVEIAP